VMADDSGFIAEVRLREAKLFWGHRVHLLTDRQVIGYSDDIGFIRFSRNIRGLQANTVKKHKRNMELKNELSPDLTIGMLI
jgi:hypothetical protein